jgi:arginase
MVAAPAQRTVAVIGASLDLGQRRRGVDMGPSAIRNASLASRITDLGLECRDFGDVVDPGPEVASAGDGNALYLDSIIASCHHVAERVRKARSSGFVPLVLGGDHSIAIGTLRGMAKVDGAGGVLWIDAHGDLNTPETSPSGNVHGMPLAVALGLGGRRFQSAEWPTKTVQRAALVGVRSLDAREKTCVRGLEEEGVVKAFTITEIDERGMKAVMVDALEFLSKMSFLHVSFDLDAVDPMFAPGVGTPVRGGITYREANLAAEMVAESGRLDSLELVEVNPILDRENQTAILAVELAASALGARIL